MLHTCVKKHTIVISTRRTTEVMEGGKYQALTSNSVSQRQKKCMLLLWELPQIQAHTQFLGLSYSFPLKKKLYLFFKEAPFLELQIFWKVKNHL